MTKDVLVSVRGAHIADGETNNLEVITAGSYYFKNGKHYIIYDEILEGEEGSIRNTIKANADSVDMIKGGDARAHMIFQENRPNVSCYVTPYGQMIVGVTTDRIKINEGRIVLRMGDGGSRRPGHGGQRGCQHGVAAGEGG